MNLGAKGPREPLVGWQERLVFTFPQWDCDGWDEIPPFLRQHPPVPQEWAGALAPSFLWEALLPHPMQSGSWTRSLWNSRKLGLKGDLRGHSSPSRPPDRLILSFSHHRRPSEFSPRPSPEYGFSLLPLGTILTDWRFFFFFFFFKSGEGNGNPL